MSLDIAALRAEYAEWKAQRTDITVSQRVLSAFRARPLTAAQAYEALGISHQCGHRLLAKSINNLSQLGLLSPDASHPRLYRFIQDTSHPLPAALRVQQRAEAKARLLEQKRLSHQRRIQSAMDAELRKARRRGIGIEITPKQIGTTAGRPRLATGQTETLAQYLARGGQIEILPHNFDARPTSFPGRRPVNNHNQRGRNQP